MPNARVRVNCTDVLLLLTCRGQGPHNDGVPGYGYEKGREMTSATRIMMIIAVTGVVLSAGIASACGDCQLTHAIWTDLTGVVGPVLLVAVVLGSLLDFWLLRIQFRGVWDKVAYRSATYVLPLLAIIPALNCAIVGYRGHPVRSAAFGLAGLLGARVACLVWFRLTGRTPVRMTIVGPLAAAPVLASAAVLCVMSLIQHGALPLPWSHLR